MIRCKLEADKHCVYINGDVDVDNLNANACIKAIMWRTKDGDGANARFGISDKTAKMVFSHRGTNNPWYCTDDPDKANAFVGCLTGVESDCKVGDMACASAGQVSVCQVNTEGQCQ